MRVERPNGFRFVQPLQAVRWSLALCNGEHFETADVPDGLTREQDGELIYHSVGSLSFSLANPLRMRNTRR